MIHVIASVRVREGSLARYLEIVRDNALRVREEKGCIEYTPAVDIDAGLPPQDKDGLVVTIIEKWEDLASLHDHLGSPNMAGYREKVRDLVEGVSLKVLGEA